MADREVDQIPQKVDLLVKRMDKSEGNTASTLELMQAELRGMSSADALRLLKGVDQKENKSAGDNLEIVDTRDGKVVILSGKGGEALIGMFKK